MESKVMWFTKRPSLHRMTKRHCFFTEKDFFSRRMFETDAIKHSKIWFGSVIKSEPLHDSRILVTLNKSEGTRLATKTRSRYYHICSGKNFEVLRNCTENQVVTP